MNLLLGSLNPDHARAKKEHRPPKGDRRIFWVAGARYANYMQIEIRAISAGCLMFAFDRRGKTVQLVILVAVVRPVHATAAHRRVELS